MHELSSRGSNESESTPKLQQVLVRSGDQSSYDSSNVLCLSEHLFILAQCVYELHERVDNQIDHLAGKRGKSRDRNTGQFVPGCYFPTVPSLFSVPNGYHSDVRCLVPVPLSPQLLPSPPDVRTHFLFFWFPPADAMMGKNKAHLTSTHYLAHTHVCCVPI